VHDENTSCDESIIRYIIALLEQICWNTSGRIYEPGDYLDSLFKELRNANRRSAVSGKDHEVRKEGPIGVSGQRGSRSKESENRSNAHSG